MAVMQEHLVFGRPKFGILQAYCFIQIDENLLVPLLVDCRTLRNKFLVHDGLQIETLPTL
jgi:hypothetical protein